MRTIIIFSLLGITTTFAFQNLLPFYYRIGDISTLAKKNIKKVVIDGVPTCLYVDKNNTYYSCNDVCPHRGASLAQGTVNTDSCGGVKCRYHSMDFNKKNDKSNHPKYNIKVYKNDLYFSPDGVVQDDEIYIVPEYFNKTFVPVSGDRILNCNIKILLENVLDMQHISSIHSFGNKDFPIPFDLGVKRLSDKSFRSTFNYRAGRSSIFKQFEKNKENHIYVENEYHLSAPTVLSRVRINNFIKTVVVNAYPIDKDHTQIFWTIYRNFFNISWLNWLIDKIFVNLMNIVLDEDISILSEVYDTDTSKQFHTKFDKIQVEFRKDYAKFLAWKAERELNKTLSGPFVS